jgi:alpha-L-fucosidase 2
VLTSETWTLAVAVTTDFDGSEPSTVVASLLDRAASSSPADLIRVAKEAHREIFDRAAIELELADPVSSRLRTMPTDARVHAVRAGGVDDDLTLLVADYGRYLMIASGAGGSLPPTLQGVWNEDTEPAWSSNWTLNINAQMNLWSADAFHVTEAVSTLEHLVRRLSVAGERTAREIYGARGWVIHHNADLWLNTAPTTLVEIGFFPAAGLWLLQQLWQHHLHYPEENLDERLLSLFEGCVAFLETWLVEDADGHLVTSPSSTPENAYLLGDTQRPVSRAVDPEYWRHGWLGEAPTLDMWLVRDTLRSAIAAASAAGSPTATIERWTRMLDRLRPVPIIDGEIPEWTWPYRALELGHRHLSPLYAVFPGTDNFVTPSPMVDAARRTLLNRQAHVESTSNGWGGWSRVWAGAAWARLRDGDRALASVESLLRTGIAPGSLLHAFPDFDGHPAADAVHQSDANMGLPAVICELIMQSTAGTITLLPALPRRWTAGRVRALRARGGIDVTFEWRDAAVTMLQLDSTRDQRLHIVTPHETRDVQLVAGVPLLLTFDESPSGGRKGTDS